MNRSRASKLLTTLLCVAVSLTSSVTLGGPNDRYSVVTLVNETPYRVDYSYAWGGDGSTHYNNYLKPNSKYTHWWTFDYPGQDHAPWLYVELEGDSSPYRLRSFYSPDKNSESGRVYYIRFENNKFKLYGKLYTN